MKKKITEKIILEMKKRPLCVFTLMVIFLIVLLQFLNLPLLPKKSGDARAEAAMQKQESVCIMGVVKEATQKEDYSSCVLKKAALLQSHKEERISDVKLSFSESTAYPIGAVIYATGTLSPLPKPTNMGQFDSELYYKTKKIAYLMKNAKIKVVAKKRGNLLQGLYNIRTWFWQRMLHVYQKEDAGVLSAMILGDKTELSEEERLRWQVGGISHMLAISGLHLTLLGMGIYKLLKKCYCPFSMAAGISTAVLLLYAVFTGMSVSTMRAFLMFAIAMGAPIGGRTYDMPTSLATAVLLMLIDNPYYLFYSAFQMSAGAVLLCCLFQKRSPLTVSYMLYLGMLPIILSCFFETPLYSIAVNLIVVPLLPLLLGFGFLGTVLGFAAAGLPAHFLLFLIRLLLGLSLHLPYSSIILGKPAIVRIFLYYTALFAWSYFMKKYQNYKRRCLLLVMIPLLIVLLTWKMPQGLRMTFLDVGQGDGCVIACPDGSHILVDGGSSSVTDVGTQRVLPALKYMGIRKIDYVIATHMDADHINGIEELLASIQKKQTSLRVKTVVLPYLKNRGAAYRSLENAARGAHCRILHIKDGDKLHFHQVSLTCLNPDCQLEENPPDENAQCVVMALQYRQFDALLTGDVCKKGEEHVYERLKGQNRKWEVLKVAHHGSRLSSPAKLLHLLSPKVSVISVGAHNRYHHPSRELLERLRDIHSRIYRTDQSGAVTVRTNGRRFWVTEFSRNLQTQS